MYGQTEIAATDIKKIISQLSSQHDPCSASTGFEHQFQVRNVDQVVIKLYDFVYSIQDLGRTTSTTDRDQYSVATSEENKEKNRYSNKLPSKLHHRIIVSFHDYVFWRIIIKKIIFGIDNLYRVCLKSTAMPGSDYINASFIDVSLYKRLHQS